MVLLATMKLRVFIGTLLLIAVFAVPLTSGMLMGIDVANAQTLKTEQSLEGRIVPCLGVGADGSQACNWCQLVKLIGNLVQYSIYLAVMLAAIMFTYAGFLFLTNNGKPANISKAWLIFRRVIFGTIAILAAWLIVDAIMDKLATGVGTGKWNELVCNDPNFTRQPPAGVDDNDQISAPYPGSDFYDELRDTTSPPTNNSETTNVFSVPLSI